MKQAENRQEISIVRQYDKARRRVTSADFLASASWQIWDNNPVLATSSSRGQYPHAQSWMPGNNPRRQSAS